MALLSAGCGGTAQKSPSGNIRAEVFAGKEGLYYTVTHDGRTVIDTSAMGVTVDGTELFRDAALRPAGTRKIDETYSVTGRKAVSEGRCNEYLFDVTHRPSGYKYRLQTRLYDDGFAFRVGPPGRRHADRQRGSGPMAAAPPEQGLVRRAEFRVETAHLCRRVDIHDGRQPAHRLPAGTGADHAAALPPPPTNT